MGTLLTGIFLLIMVGNIAPREIRVGYISSDPIIESPEDGLATLELAVIKLKQDKLLPDDLDIK